MCSETVYFTYAVLCSINWLHIILFTLFCVEVIFFKEASSSAPLGVSVLSWGRWSRAVREWRRSAASATHVWRWALNAVRVSNRHNYMFFDILNLELFVKIYTIYIFIYSITCFNKECVEFILWVQHKDVFRSGSDQNYRWWWWSSWGSGLSVWWWSCKFTLLFRYTDKLSVSPCFSFGLCCGAIMLFENVPC